MIVNSQGGTINYSTIRTTLYKVHVSLSLSIFLHLMHNYFKAQYELVVAKKLVN